MGRTRQQSDAKTQSALTVLGLDPGLATVGFGCLRLRGDPPELIDAGTIETPSSLAAGRRLAMIYDDLKDLLGRLKPDLIGIEKLFFNQNITTGISVAEARGVILMAADQSGATIIELTPSQVKLSLTGWGKATKPQMRSSIKQHLKINPESLPDDCADALATALAAAQLQGLEAVKMGEVVP